MRAKVTGTMYFLLAISAVLIVLATLNWLPMALQKDTLRKYDSLEEARVALNMRRLHVPSYFPQSITWPPARILAQAKPYPAVLMVFHRAEKQEPALVVSQAASDSFPAGLFIALAEVRQKVPYKLKERAALLEVGVCGDGEPCSRLAWTEGDLRITLAMKAPPFELIKIAESMLH